MFDVVGGGQQGVSGERLKALGRILQINEEILSEVADQFEIGYATMVAYEDFQMYYFEVFS